MTTSLNQSPVGETLADLDSQSAIRVLHVDDEPDFAELVSIYLERESSSLEVVTENDPEEGLERLASEQFDCIVSDYDMPLMDGLEFLEAVREEYQTLPFILFTGKGSEEIASEAITAGVSDYLEKEGGTDQYTVLANRVENLVQQHQATHEVRRGFTAIETAQEGISFLDQEGKFIYVNPAYAETYGYERDELVGEHWEIMYPEEHVGQVHEEILPSVPEGGKWSGESVHLHKDGTRLVVDHALAYCHEGTLLCFIQDITETRELERSLERERQKFEQFVNAVEEYAIFSLDPEGYITSWNKGAERLKGYSQEEILGRHFSVFYPEEKVVEGYPEQLLETAIEAGAVTDTGNRVRKDGSEFFADVVITAVFDDEDQPQGFLKVTRDTTLERRAKQAFEAEEDFLVEALNVLDDVFYMLDENANIVRVTDRAAEVTGYSREELLSMSPMDLFPPDQRPMVQETIAEAIETGSATIEANLLTKHGREYPYEFRTCKLTDSKGNVFLAGIGRDVRNRNRRERQLKQQLEQFQHFGNVLSHDLRTPLETAKGRLELGQETNDEEHLRKADESLERLDELIDDLAEVMRQGEIVGDITTVDLGACIQSVWQSLETADASLSFEDDALIQADEEALKRLIENLLKNALDHGGDEVEVTVGMLPDGFYVEDNGPGIPKSERDRIFEAGYSTKDSVSGFGLASVHQLVIGHGWQISVGDGGSGGVRFEITDVELSE